MSDQGRTAQLTAQLSRLRLGDILLAAKLITREQLQEALAQQKEEGGRLGEILVRLGAIPETDMQRYLARQLGLQFDPGPELQLEPAIARQIPEEMALKEGVLPLRLEANGNLVVATTDPLNYQALENIALKTGRRLQHVVVTKATLHRASIRVYGIPEGATQEELAVKRYDLDASEENQTVRLLHTLLRQAIESRASDIHMEPTEDRCRVRYRIDGVLIEVTPVPLALHAGLISRLKVMGSMEIAERRVPQDGQIQLLCAGRRYDLRLSTLPTIHGERVAIRILDRSSSLRSLAQIGMDPVMERNYRELIHRPNGMILITGPTGSGKSTTLMGTLSEINTPGKHIMTIEDPVEYHIDGITQVQVNNKSGLTFASGLRSFLRQDPDVIMVGEIRDSETAEIAIRAALTGHLLLSTLHTNQAAATIGRLTEMGLEPFLLATSLLGVVAQRLVRLLCTRCKEEYELAPDDPARFLPGIPAGPCTLHRARGCGFCEGTGYQGRVPIFELLTVSGPVRELIVGGAPASEILAAARLGGMRTLWESGLDLVFQGRTSIEEVQRVAFMEA